jgi:hypothetical protein
MMKAREDDGDGQLSFNLLLALHLAIGGSIFWLCRCMSRSIAPEMRCHVAGYRKGILLENGLNSVRLYPTVQYPQSAVLGVPKRSFAISG